MITRVCLEGAHCGHNNGGIGSQARGAALDIEETLSAHVGAEACLGDEVVAAADTDLVGDDAAVAVGDVAEWASVYEHRSAFERLHQVGLERIAHDRRHGACTLQGFCSDRLARWGVANNNATEALAHVFERRAQSKDGHHFGGGSDVESGLAGDAIFGRAEADDDVAQRALIDVEHSSPRDVVEVEVEFVALVEVVVEHGREHVVRRGDGVEVAGEVQVEQLHWDDLAVAAAGRATLDAERWSHRRLANRNDALLADVLEGLTESHGGGGLSFAERRWRDGRNHHVLCFGAIGQLLHCRQLDLGQAVAVGLDQVRPDAHLGSDVEQRLQRSSLGDFKI
ncbi:unannotated protein [freshwater metagenome]|uniref:Unannotated protein n=1 Tax=freshwater metagenome TaxID=449393 RepID=A0A6J6XPW1_9ZZZZ